MNSSSQTTSTGTIAAYFENHSDAERAVEALRDAGFNSAQIGVAHRAGPYSDTSSDSSTGTSVDQKTEGAWDKFKNFFTGNPEPYADEQNRGDLATREITDDGASSYPDDFHQNLSNLSVDENRSRYMSHRFQRSESGAVVTVNADSRTAEAQEILSRYGADLGENAASYDYSQTGDRGQGQNLRNIQLLGEILRVHKDRVNRGEVRVRKEIITENQTVQVPVTREELVVERRPVSGETAAQGAIGQDQEIRIPLTEETASVEKSTVVREEVSVGKRSVQNVRDLSGDVRREELVVEDQSKKAVNE